MKLQQAACYILFVSSLHKYKPKYVNEKVFYFEIFTGGNVKQHLYPQETRGSLHVSGVSYCTNINLFLILTVCLSVENRPADVTQAVTQSFPPAVVKMN